ncbi:MAG: hypothetical protein K6E76_05375 [Patescibacteria group bacterium]|nr:hypothetical protein [Patescibacteria group bacterium]
MNSNDKGEVVFKNFLSFKKSGEYKIEVEDYYGETDYVIIKVGDDDDEEYDDIDVSTNKKKIDTGTWANISIKMGSTSYK